MRLLTQEPDLLVFGGQLEYRILGIGLAIAGIAVAIIPMLMYLRDGRTMLLIPAALGVLLFLGGVWAISYRHSVTFDGRTRAIRTVSSSLTGRTEDVIPFSQIREIGLKTRIYSSVSSQTVRQMFFMELRLHEGRNVPFEDEEFNDTEDAARQRASEIARLTGAPLSGEPPTP
jgi:hypothetical protein